MMQDRTDEEVLTYLEETLAELKPVRRQFAGISYLEIGKIETGHLQITLLDSDIELSHTLRVDSGFIADETILSVHLTFDYALEALAGAATYLAKELGITP